jgi:endoglucanase
MSAFSSRTERCVPRCSYINGIHEWCEPDLTGTGLTPAQANQARYDQLNHAVDALESQRDTSVYLDGTHSAWLGVGDISERLVKAGVERAQGFFLNVSNYQFAPNSTAYGTWISDCITYATAVNSGDFAGCPNQYWNGGPDGTMIAQLLGPWKGVALSPYGLWSDTTTEPDLKYVRHQRPVREHARHRDAHHPVRHRHQPRREGTQ